MIHGFQILRNVTTVSDVSRLGPQYLIFHPSHRVQCIWPALGQQNFELQAYDRYHISLFSGELPVILNKLIAFDICSVLYMYFVL